MAETSSLDSIRNTVRNLMKKVAILLNKLSGGKLRPSTVTITGLLAHIPIAVIIASRHFVLGGILLIIFGLFDSLDGELARLQERVSTQGMLLDSITDRMKEVLLFIGVAYAFVSMGNAGWAVWAVAACGASLLTSYVNAWGEVALTRHGHKRDEVNKIFRGGIMSFEIRMATLIIALLLNKLELALIVITVLAWWTAMNRLMAINDSLGHDKN